MINQEKKSNNYITHIVCDEKFIDVAIRMFENEKIIESKYIIIGEKFPLKYIKSDKVEFHSKTSAKILLKSKSCKGIILHSLNNTEILRLIPNTKKVLWIGWGYDYYKLLLTKAFPKGLLLDKTNCLLSNFEGSHLDNNAKITTKIKIKIKNGFLYKRYQRHMINKINYFSPVLNSEYKLVEKFNKWFTPKYIEWNYCTAEEDLCSSNDLGKTLGDNILVGNSASFENNHIEAFNYINENFHWEDRKIICPLSYGNKWYKEKICEIGYGIFGENFIPINNFINLDEYLELLQSCGHVFMNHLRQQAVGNICIMMLKGAKIYMNPESIFYQWLKEKGAYISLIKHNSKKEMGKIHLTQLTENEKNSNIEIINSHWGRTNQLEKTKNICRLFNEK